MSPHGPAGRREVAVLGAGPDALSAALALLSRDVTVHVLEAEDRVGGLCRTLERDGFRFDLGGHRCPTRDLDPLGWLHGLMRTELVRVSRSARLYSGGRYHRLPLSAGKVLRTLPPLVGLGLMTSFAFHSLRDLFAPRDPENLRDLYAAYFGAKAFDRLLRPYVEKVWGAKCEELSADWMARRLTSRSLLRALGGSVISYPGLPGEATDFLYPRRGIGRISVRLAEEVERGGGRVLLNCSLRSLRYRGPRAWSVSYSCAGTPATLQATDVVGTLPAPRWLPLLDPACDEDGRRAAGSLRFRDLLTVTVLLRKPSATPDTILYVADGDLLVARIHEPKNWSREMVPGPDLTSLVCECFCSQGDSVSALPDARIAQRVVAEIADALGLVRPSDVLGTQVVRTPLAVPIRDLDYAGNVGRLRRALERREGLHLFEPGGLFGYSNVGESVEKGRSCAKRILDVG